MTRLIFCLVTILCSFAAKAQLTMHKMVHAGYVYQNASFAELGGRLLFLENDDVVFRLGAAGMVGAPGGKITVLPKVQGDVLINFERNVDFYHSYYLLAGAEVTTKYIAPKLGATLFGLVDLSAGYAFPLDKNGVHGKEFKGLNINFTVSIPTVLIYDLTH